MNLAFLRAAKIEKALAAVKDTSSAEQNPVNRFLDSLVEGKEAREKAQRDIDAIEMKDTHDHVI